MQRRNRGFNARYKANKSLYVAHLSNTLTAQKKVAGRSIANFRNIYLLPYGGDIILSFIIQAICNRPGVYLCDVTNTLSR